MRRQATGAVMQHFLGTQMASVSGAMSARAKRERPMAGSAQRAGRLSPSFLLTTVSAAARRTLCILQRGTERPALRLKPGQKGSHLVPAFFTQHVAQVSLCPRLFFTAGCALARGCCPRVGVMGEQEAGLMEWAPTTLIGCTRQRRPTLACPAWR